MSVSMPAANAAESETAGRCRRRMHHLLHVGRERRCSGRSPCARMVDFEPPRPRARTHLDAALTALDARLAYRGKLAQKFAQIDQN